MKHSELEQLFAEHRDNADFKCGEDCFCWKVQEWLDKVSDVRKYHLVSLQTHEIKVEHSSSDELEITEYTLELQEDCSDDLFVIEIDPTGEIEIRPAL
jgi:hypothetical protein